MKRRYRYTSALGAFGISILMAQPAPTSVNLHLEKAASTQGPWSLLPADGLADSGDGGLLDPESGSEAFYRLRIDQKDPQGGPLGLPLAAVEPASLKVALERLDSLRPEEPDWLDAELGPVVTPIYSPAFQGGREPAWFEFKVVPGPAPRVGLNSTAGGFPQSPPVLPELERGYLLVSSGNHDEPVPQYATQGPTPTERLRYLARTTHIRVVRYSESFWVAEDGDGAALATLGSTPFKLDPAIGEVAGTAFGVEVEDGKVVSLDPVPELSTGPFESYESFRKDYLEGAVPKMIREYQAAFGKMEWDLRDDQMPEAVRVPVKDQVTVLEGTRFRSAGVEAEEVAEVTPNAKGGLDILGLVDGVTLLTAIRADGSVALFALVVGDPAQRIQLAGWTSWTTYYGASCAEIPPYYQEWDLAGTCNNGWSGCGPTAWAMFYGYWDSKGVSNLIAGGTPWSNNDAVRDLIGVVFDDCNTWCTSINSQAATNPWDMYKGYHWAVDRGEGISYSTRWCVPYTSSSPRNKAIAAIRDHDRPAIVGTGYFAHYPFAYGYRYRKYKWAGITWDTERQWKVNQGGGSSSCEWVSASSCWYGMDARCY
ncbi:MAG: hypothetical protein KDM81_01735 [Verrucomicrobiae bacterium]|nr:hypothetical protein [Verrucomicrobiae bacterium]MCP5520385.1 hypothetical protein [Verrucomicrobiales bacterium]